MKLLVLLGEDFKTAVEFAKKRNLDPENSIIYLATSSDYPNQNIVFDDENNHMFENQTTYDVMKEFINRRDFNYMDSFMYESCKTHDGSEIGEFVLETNEYEYKVELITYHPAWGAVEIHMVSMADRMAIQDESLRGINND